MVIRIIRRTFSVLWEALTFGKAEEKQLDMLIARDKARLKAIEKMTKETNEAYKKVFTQLLKQGSADVSEFKAKLDERDKDFAEKIRLAKESEVAMFEMQKKMSLEGMFTNLPNSSSPNIDSLASHSKDQSSNGAQEVPIADKKIDK